MAQAHRKSALPPGIAGRLKELQQNAKRAAPLLKAMSNPSRLVILCKIAEGERSVGEIERQVGLTQSGISQHLAVLRRAQIVVTRRERQTIYYSLANAEVIALMASLHKIFCKTARPARRAKARELA